MVVQESEYGKQNYQLFKKIQEREFILGFFYAVGLFNSVSSSPPTRFKTVISQAVRTGIFWKMFFSVQIFSEQRFSGIGLF